jgi:hypothetical protein
MTVLVLAWLLATAFAGTALAACAPRAIPTATVLVAVLAPLIAVAALLCAL